VTAKTEEQNGQGEPPELELSSWKFYNRPPTRADVVDRIKTLPDVHGVSPINYVDYVQALPQQENNKKKTTRGGRTFWEDNYQDVWVLYYSIAGRTKMLEDAQRLNGWTVEFVPEPATSTGNAGLLALGDGSLAYRVAIKITKDGKLLGTRTGMSSRSGKNAWEKVETAANGRAMGSWGFGVCPGSGIASLEEMQSSDSEPAAPKRGGKGIVDGGEPRDDEKILEAVRTNLIQLQQLRAIPEDQANEQAAQWLVKNFSYKLDEIMTPRFEMIWDAVRPTHRMLINNMLRDFIAEEERRRQPL
jgi:hypothetical protein